jgi:Fic family protein
MSSHESPTRGVEGGGPSASGLDHGDKTVSESQRKVMNLLRDAGPGGFEGGMSTKKYEHITGASRATASRELIDLQARGLLDQAGAGRSTRYYLRLPGRE